MHGINFINGVRHSFGCGFDGGGGGIGIGGVGADGVGVGGENIGENIGDNIGHKKQDGSTDDDFDGCALVVEEVGGSALTVAEGCGMAATRAMAKIMAR